jgi:hypothetical protein
MGLKLGEIPVSMNMRLKGASSIRSWRAAYYMIKVTVAILVDRARSAGH